MHSPWLDNIFKDEMKEATVDKIVTKLQNWDFDAFVVKGYSSALIAPVLAYIMDKKIVLVRGKDDDSHSFFDIEGETDQRCIFVDDLIASGATYRYVKNHLTKHNCTLVGIYLYSNSAAHNQQSKAENFEIPIISVFNDKEEFEFLRREIAPWKLSKISDEDRKFVEGCDYDVPRLIQILEGV